MNRKILIFAFVFTIIVAAIFLKNKTTSNLPLVAIANWGSHASLDACIVGIKQELAKQGYVENETVRYEIQHVNFDPALIPQMITSLKNKHPDVMVVMSTPVAQFAKGAVHNIPLVYAVITDPVQAGLEDMIGASDKQNLDALLIYAKQLLPHATRVGILYSTAESNDMALLNMMEEATQKAQMQLVAIPVESTRDVALRVQGFKDKVDLIYVGTSGPIQPTLPVIAAAANKMHIPVFNADEAAVKEGLVFASFGVNYVQVGVNAGKLVSAILKGENPLQLKPIYPTLEDHKGITRP